MCEWPLWKKSYGQLNENKIVHPCVCVCLHVNKVYKINGSLVGLSKLDKNNCLYSH